MLSAGAKTEVTTGNNEITCFHAGREGRVGIFHNVFCQLREIASQMSQTSGRDMVGGYVIAKFEGFSFKQLHYLSWVGYFAGNSCYCCRSRAAQVYEGFRVAHSSLEVSVSCGQAGFAVSQCSLM